MADILLKGKAHQLLHHHLQNLQVLNKEEEIELL